MNYKFPFLVDYGPVLSAIKGLDEFVIARRDGYSVINYVVQTPETFSATHDSMIVDAAGVYHPKWVYLRECRGLIFDGSGKLISRPFHKFFNLNEKEETQINAINFQNIFIQDKMDGSMIRPVIVNSHLRLATKMGITEVSMQAETWLASRNPEYQEWVYHQYKLGYTPLFEWIGPNNKIVVDYTEEELVLLAIRDNLTGMYLDISEVECPFKICPSYTAPKDIKSFVEEKSKETGCEGYIINFLDGHKLKIKNDWYVRIHKVKDRIRTDRHILSLMLNNELDDLLPFLDNQDLTRVSDYEVKFWKCFQSRFSELVNLSKWAIDQAQGDRKVLATEVIPKLDDPHAARYIFACMDGKSISGMLMDLAKASCSNNKSYEKFCEIIGIPHD
jgi:RNA ligase